MLAQQLLIGFSLTSICSPNNGTFQQRLNCLMVTVDVDPVQGISHPIICPLLILQSKFKEASEPTHLYPMASRLRVVRMYVNRSVVCPYHKGHINKVLLKMLSDAPLKSKEFELRAVVVFLCWCKGVTTKSNGMVAPVILFLRQHGTQPFLGGISLQEKWFAKSGNTNTGAD